MEEWQVSPPGMIPLDIAKDCIVSSAVYTLHVALAVYLLFTTYTNTNRPHRKKHLFFVAALLCLATVQTSAHLYFSLSKGQEHMVLWVRYFTRAQSVGNDPSLFDQAKAEGVLLRAHYDVALYFLGFPSYFVTYLANGYMLFRCFIIWNRSYWVLVLPSILFMTAFANSIVQARNLMGTEPIALKTVSLQLQWALCLSLNTSITLLITIRLLSVRRTVSRALGIEHASAYTGVIAIVVESSLIYTLVVAIGYPLYGPTAVMWDLIHATENMFSPLLVQAECIAAELIVLRFVSGRAWTEERTRQMEQASRSLPSVLVIGRTHATCELSTLGDSESRSIEMI